MTPTARCAGGLAVAGLVLAIGAAGGAGRAAAAPVAATPVAAAPIAVTAVTSAPASAAPAAAAPVVGQDVAVRLTPCSARADGSCTVAPVTVAVTFPAGQDTGTVQVAWKTVGRPSGFPGPAQAVAELTVPPAGCAKVADSTSTTCTWPWPKALEATGSAVVLNGTYQVTPCAAGGRSPTTTTTPTTNTTPGTRAAAGSGPVAVGSAAGPSGLVAVCSARTTPGVLPATVLLAVPPAAPGAVDATGSAGVSGAVTVTWAPGVDPDLVGYQVARDGLPVYGCSLHGVSIPGDRPCPSQLRFTDHPQGVGTVTYGVQALRFGPDSLVSDDLASGTATSTAVIGGTGTVGTVPALPAVATPRSVTAGTPPPAVTTAPVGVAPSTIEPGYGSIPYENGIRSATVLAGLTPPTTGHRNVDDVALVAAGLLLLAVASHLLFLRAAVARYRVAHQPPALEAAPTPRRGAFHLRWAQWPPLVRDPAGTTSVGEAPR